MSLTKVSVLMQVLNSTRKHYTKNEYFPKHILFTTIYLLWRQKLNNKKYSEQEINMRKFIQATEHDVHICEKFGDFTFYVFL
jgi:hypothetical protein